MQVQPSPKPNRKPFRRRTSVQVQLILGTGFVLLLAVLTALIGLGSLISLRQSVNTSLVTANTVNQLGLGIQTQFLLARQNETNLLNRWRTTGFNVEISGYVYGNEYRLAEARTYLNQLDALAKSSPDPAILSLTTEIENLRPLLDEYEAAFQLTVDTLRERTRPEGVESQMNTELALLEKEIAPLSPEFQILILEIQSNQQAYFATGKQEFVDNVRIKTNELIDQIEISRPVDLVTSSLTPIEMVAHAEAYLSAFSEMISLEQSTQINSAIFQNITKEINESVDNIGEYSLFGLNSANAELERTGRNSIVALGVTAFLALVIGITGATFSARQVIVPVRQLSQSAEALGRGELSTRAPLRGGAEFVTLAETFNTMADQLQQTLAGLEQRVAERTLSLERRSSQLRAASEIAREAASVRDPNELLNRAVTLIRDRFGFYHAGIFLLDERSEYAVLRAATGEAGQAMLERGHKLKIGEVGIVGYVGNTGQPRIALDVGADAVHFRNPLLPETRSEMGLPLKIGRQVIGVLDVQSREASAFEQDDVTSLQIMADQLAVAIENARLFQESQDSIHQLETLYGRYSQRAWERMGQISGIRGYQYDRTGIHSVTTETGAGKKHASKEIPTAPVSVPLKVRGQVIGALDVWPESESWSAESTELLQEVSSRVSQTLESARIFEEAQARAIREQTLNQFTSRFTRSLDLDSLLATAVRELGQMPNVTEASVHIGPPTSQADASRPAQELPSGEDQR